MGYKFEITMLDGTFRWMPVYTNTLKEAETLMDDYVEKNKETMLSYKLIK